MKKLWKRNAVVAVIVLFVCVAAYLNWSYSDQAAAIKAEDGVLQASEPSSTRTLGEAVLVSSTDIEGDSALLSGDRGVDDGYFDNARLSREQARDSALAILQQTVTDVEADETAVQEATSAITAMAEATLTESEVESLITAKGYADCVTYIGADSVSVVVDGGETGLNATDVAVITDIVISETGYDANQIKVIDTSMEASLATMEALEGMEVEESDS